MTKTGKGRMEGIKLQSYLSFIKLLNKEKIALEPLFSIYCLLAAHIQLYMINLYVFLQIVHTCTRSACSKSKVYFFDHALLLEQVWCVCVHYLFYSFIFYFYRLLKTDTREKMSCVAVKLLLILTVIKCC